MGGAIGEGNRTPAAEFNIWADPEAAQRVFVEGLDTTMVGLDVTHRALITDEHTERMRAAGRVGKVVAELMDFYARFHKARYPDLAGSPMHDPVCIAHLVDPTLMDVRDAFIEVDCSTGPSWGRTNVDWRGREHFGAPNAKVGVDIDGERFAELVVERISSLTDDRLRRDRAARRARCSTSPRRRRGRGMEELGRRFAAARPTAVIVLTPHGLHIDDHFAVVRSRRLEGDASQWSDSGERLRRAGRARARGATASPSCRWTGCRRSASPSARRPRATRRCRSTGAR